MILNAVRALWLASALVPGFAALVLYQMARLRLYFCSGSGGGELPATLNEWRHLLPGLSAGDHILASLIFLPVMAIALFVPARRVWLAVAAAIVWMAAVLIHLGLQIPQSCPVEPQRLEPLWLYIWPAALATMLTFRLNTSRQAARNRDL
ncbi:hypothetical protein [Paracoccus aminophilus]|uniref:Uncharacterized protein n=1 Tax=Paracoccus aminophilus JCM 7686 TaxID=1367847 RepID=S5XR49_PARAH|nr:hypothetical protein [Paracoccus aminophilus]AGT09884.1 hypothetical protein JCM7686_2828 [Paracoccus aminophilus JCM 7686]